MVKLDWYRVLDIAWKIATGVGLFRLWIWGKNKIDHWKNNREQWRILSIDQSKTIAGDLNEIKKQLNPNGGNSIYDIVFDLRFGQRSTWELLDVAVWESDKTGKITYVSQALCSMIGCSVEDMMDYSWVNRVQADYRDRIFRSWKFSVENASEFNETYPYIKSDGCLQMINAVAVHNKNKDGSVLSSKGRFIKIGEPYLKT